MKYKLKGKVFVVTGASQGIGRETPERLRPAQRLAPRTACPVRRSPLPASSGRKPGRTGQNPPQIHLRRLRRVRKGWEFAQQVVGERILVAYGRRPELVEGSIPQVKASQTG